MSTKTTFKRIALVAVAALGLGVLSVAPSSAAVSGIAISTPVNGTSTNSADGYVSDSTTAGTFTVSGLTDSGYESLTVQLVAKSTKAAAATNAFLYFVDSATSGLTTVDSFTAITTTDSVTAAGTSKARGVLSADDTSTGVLPSAGFRIARTTAGYMGAKFAIQLDSESARAAGTYTWTVIAKGYSDAAGNVTSTTADVSIVVPDDEATTASESEVVDPAQSSATLSAGATWGTVVGTDSAVSTLATASATVKATIRVYNENVDGYPVAESVTVTVTGPGVARLNGSTSAGKSIVLVGDGDDIIEILSDGTAGVSSIVVKTTSITYAAKTVTFYAADAATAAASAYTPVISVGGTGTILASMKDVNGNIWAGTAYVYAATAADALIAGSQTPAACSYVASLEAHSCSVSGKLAGTANFIVIDAATAATATATSNTVALRVSTGVPTTVKLAFDKATYGPGEKAQIWVSAVDAAGLALGARTITNMFATGGITSSSAFASNSDALTGVTVDIAGSTSATAGTVAGYKVYTVYMPQASGDITITATGGTGIALAGRVAATATASVVNSSVDAATDAANEATDAANAATDAALAAADSADAATEAAQEASDAVAELSTQVAALMASLKAQIKSLTNLVIKIQKKLK